MGKFKLLAIVLLVIGSAAFCVPSCLKAAGILSPEYRYGYINERGEFAIPPKFDYAKSFEGGKAEIYTYPNPQDDNGHNAYVYYINKKGEIISSRYITDNFSWNRRFFLREGQNLKIVVLPKRTEGLLPCQSDEGGNLWGFKDYDDKWIIQPKYNYVTQFRNGIAFVNIDRDGETRDRGGIWGAIDKKGNWVMKPTCTRLYEFSEGLALCRVEK